MNNGFSIRQQVADILTEHFGDRSEGRIFLPENTTKRTGAGKKHTAYELRTSQGWSAKSIGHELIWLSCIGVSMSEFIKEYNSDNAYYQRSKTFSFTEITIYRDKPEWKTRGYVIGVNKEKNLVVLHFSDLWMLDKIETSVTKETPRWLIENSFKLHATFTCKIYQSWLSFETVDGYNWSKVWKTFKLDSFLSDDELLYYF